MSYHRTTSLSLDRIAVLRWNTSAITVAGRGSGGNYSNDLIGPYGLAWDSSNTLYIVEIDAHRIRKWIPGATSGTIIAGLTNGVSTNHNNGFNHPVDLFVETNGDMYITDRTNSRLQLWLNGSSTGITVAGSFMFFQQSLIQFSLHWIRGWIKW